MKPTTINSFFKENKLLVTDPEEPKTSSFTNASIKSLFKEHLIVRLEGEEDRHYDLILWKNHMRLEDDFDLLVYYSMTGKNTNTIICYITS